MADPVESQKDLFTEETEAVENENDLEELLRTEFSLTVTQATDWTISTIIDQVRKSRIQLSPQFQRRDAWTTEHKSRFIESLLLGFPIPQLVLAELPASKGRYIVIDGKQRLLSILQFAALKEGPIEFDELKLKGLEILTDLEGRTYAELRDQPSVQADTEDYEARTIRTLVIRNWNNEAILYHIFLRLNTGSVKLSPQELRNALHPGPFAEFVDYYSGESKGLRRILKTDKPDFRMRDAEIFLRYLAFGNFIGHYAGSMKAFLDSTTERLNTSWDDAKDNLELQANEFEEAVTVAFQVFGEREAFRKWKDGSFAGNFNRAVFDIIIYYLADPSFRERLGEGLQDLKEIFIELSREQPDFVTSLETTTKSLGATATRFARWTDALNRHYELNLPVPQLVNNRIRF